MTYNAKKSILVLHGTKSQLSKKILSLINNEFKDSYEETNVFYPQTILTQRINISVDEFILCQIENTSTHIDDFSRDEFDIFYENEDPYKILELNMKYVDYTHSLILIGNAEKFEIVESEKAI